MSNSEEQDDATLGTNGGARNWRSDNSEKKFFNKSNTGTGFMKQLRKPTGDSQWRTGGGESRFFGERSASKQEGNWRTNRTTNKFFGERSASSQGTNNEIGKRPSSSQSTEKRIIRKPPPKKHITFDTVDLIEKEPQDLVMFLVENLTNFTEFLAPPLPPNTVVQLLLIVEKVCLSKANLKFSQVILSRIQKNFMKQLEMYLVKLSLDEEDDKLDNQMFWQNPEAFWNSLIVVLENIIDRLQKTATHYLPKVIKACVVTIGFHKNSHGVCVKEIISKKLGYLGNRLKNLKKISDQTEDHCLDDYQTMNVYPDPSEVLTRKKPFIRQNIVDGSYMNVEHYLDTHFRLLREDFLAPLRAAICTYKDSVKDNAYVKITEFRIYTNAQFINYIYGIDRDEYDMSYIGNQVRRGTYKMLDPGSCNTKYVSHEEAFIPGSLLCFSRDNFETMFFGIATKLYGTAKCFVDVQLLEDTPFLYNQRFTMLECTNYFSTYYLVLKALQNFNTYNFPMKKYIVNVVNEPEPPAYLNGSTKYTVNNSEFTVLDFKTWPSKEELNLNEMQYEAFKHALTSKCAIIQGPPGTGKTHLGLKIAQTLIENHESYDSRTHVYPFDDFYPSDDEDEVFGRIFNFRRRLNLSSCSSSGPILVVAYTNHALDQFLEGLMPYTHDIIRIGHQCKNKNISRFTFLGAKRDGDVLKHYYSRIHEILMRKNRLMEELESALSYAGIFNIKKFAAVIPELRTSALYKWSQRKFLSWLLGKFATEQQRQARWEMTKEIENNFKDHDTNIQFRLPSDRNYIFITAELKKVAVELKGKLDFKDAVNMETMFEDWVQIEESYKKIQDNIKYLEWRLLYAAQHASLYTPKLVDDSDELLELTYNDRWILYFHWLDCYVTYLKDALKANNSTLHRIWEELEEHKQRQDSNLIHRSMIVGMTTSGAAKHRHLLENLKCPIVIAEEAAEVLESHIMVSLTQHCQHLILIGDHQQLRPSTADYQIEKQYQLGISLFERLIRNEICYSTLGVQHRMRPEISRLIVPTIYENLKDHSSVNDFPNIHGIKHNVFFITHAHLEVEIGNSRKNPHEAMYLIALARHLILQGNDPSEITILTTYKGQMYEIKDEQRKSTFQPLQEVRITVVDNFQGEENQIILLSLVRSNNQGSIGFLHVENRACVALSRAKKGFYLIGNMEMLTKSSKIWPKVNDVLEKNEQVGPGLELACQLHPEHITIAIKPEDFLKVPDGGCHLPCDANLICGHICQRKCHVTDLDHAAYCCMEPCVKILCPENHKCTKKCWEECGDCQVPMERLLACGHQQMIPCSTKIEEYKCPVPIETLLPCGHTADKPCCEDKYKFQCPVDVEILKPTCRHLVKKQCFQSVDNILCVTAVIITLECGHHTESRCWRKDDYPKMSCTELCLKSLGCGHTCKQNCHYSMDRTHSTSKNQCKEKCPKLKIGCKTNHKCNLLCSEPCQPCREDIEINLPCGHSKMFPCRKSDRIKYTCERSCKKIKSCGHVCYGKCHQTCDPKCFFKVFKNFSICGHKIKVNCSEDLNGRACTKCLKKSKK